MLENLTNSSTGLSIPIDTGRKLNVLWTIMLRKSMDWFLYDNGLRHERVNKFTLCVINISYAFKVMMMNKEAL